MSHERLCSFPHPIEAEAAVVTAPRLTRSRAEPESAAVTAPKRSQSAPESAGAGPQTQRSGPVASSEASGPP